MIEHLNKLITGDMLRFVCRNKIIAGQKDKAGGIGLKNIGRRLELLYPNAHELAIMNITDFYDVNLFIKIN